MQNPGPKLAYFNALDVPLCITIFKTKCLECAELPRVWAEFVSFGYICTFKLVFTPGGSSIVERESLSLLSHGSWASLVGRVDSWEQLTLVQTIYLGPWDSDTSLVWGCKAPQLTIPSSRSLLSRWGGWPLNQLCTPSRKIYIPSCRILLFTLQRAHRSWGSYEISVWIQ